MGRPNTLLLLFGGRPHPNAMLAAMLRPQHVVALISRDARYDVREVLAGIVSGSVTVEEVPPYQIRRVQQTLERHLEEGATAIGVTGAPLPMAVAAYEVGRRRGVPVYYVNTGQGEILDLVHLDRTPVQINVSLPTFFSVYRLTFDPLPPPTFITSPKQRTEAARVLAQKVALATELLDWLKQEEQQDTLVLRKRWPWQFTLDHWNILRRLHDLQVVQITLTGARTQPFPRSLVTIRFPSKGERQFLFGEWLEVYVTEEARTTGLLDDVQRGVRFRVGDGYREVDFLGLFRGIPLLGSCKATRKPWRKSYLDEINAVAELMGGDTPGASSSPFRVRRLLPTKMPTAVTRNSSPMPAAYGYGCSQVGNFRDGRTSYARSCTHPLIR